MGGCRAVARCMKDVQRYAECVQRGTQWLLGVQRGHRVVARFMEGAPQLNSCQLYTSQHVKLFHSFIFYHSW